MKLEKNKRGRRKLWFATKNETNLKKVYSEYRLKLNSLEKVNRE